MSRVPAGVVLAIDVGSVRVGVARSDADRTMSLPVVTLERSADPLGEIGLLIDEHDAVGVLVGLPLLLSGEYGTAASAAVAFAEQLARSREGLPVFLVDERLSTVEAGRALSASGRSSRTARHVIDQAAASVFLDYALEAERQTGEIPGVRVTLEGKRKPRHKRGPT